MLEDPCLAPVFTTWADVLGFTPAWKGINWTQLFYLFLRNKGWPFGTHTPTPHLIKPLIKP